MSEVRAAVEEAFRESYSIVVSGLSKQPRDINLVEPAGNPPEKMLSKRLRDL